MSKNKIDELKLQRLVDGVLSDEDRRAFLSGVDAYPESWREVALAFVEEQIWRGELGGDEAALEKTPAIAEVADVRKPTRNTPWLWAAAMAACLLILPGVGFHFGQLAERASIEIAANNGQDDPAPAPEKPVETPPIERDEKSDANENENDMDSRVLLANDNESIPGRAARQQAALLESPANERLRSMGYRLDSETRYVAGVLDDGREVILPVRAMMVKYHGQ